MAEVNVGDIIRGANYQDIRDEIITYLGAGNDADIGYGQSVLCQGDLYRTRTDDITARDINNLYADIVRMRVHQVGVASDSQPVSGLYEVAPGELIAADDNADSVDPVTEAFNADKGYNDLYNALQTCISASEYSKLADDQADIQAQLKVFQISNWNGTKTCRFDINFASYSNRRYFFNAGGEIRIYFEHVYEGTEAKGVQWKSFLEDDFGTFTFKKTTSTYDGSAVESGHNVSNFNLGHEDYPPSVQGNVDTLTLTIAGGRTATNYTNNYINVAIRNKDTTGSTLQITVTIADVAADSRGDTVGDFDEDVAGITKCYLGWKRPDGESLTIAGITNDQGEVISIPGVKVEGITIDEGKQF